MQNNPISLDLLNRFLTEANSKTYANKAAQKVAALRPKSEDYHFEKDGFTYHDTYFGGRDFIGEEIIYQGESPIWGANYFGFIADSWTNERAVYDFLRSALMKGDDSIPVRGPRFWEEGPWEYRSSFDGNLSNFIGQESIQFNGSIIYRGYIHGGLIK